MKKTMKNNSGIDRKYVNILGIKVLSTTEPQLLASVSDCISHNVKFSIMTPNPELVLASTENNELKIALTRQPFPFQMESDLTLPQNSSTTVS